VPHRSVVETPSKYASFTDGELLEACRAGDGVAWEALLSRFSRLVYAIPRRAGLSSEASADIFQDVFARLLEHVDRLEQPERVRSWIVTTARRATLHALRGPVQTAPGDEADRELLNVVDTDPLPGEAMERLEQWHAMRAAVQQLDSRCGELVQLLFYGSERPSYTDVAAALGVPAGSIGPTRARCLEKLRRLLERTRSL
jgi:RNA polymerase sigma factor (sigma-70 family)